MSTDFAVYNATQVKILVAGVPVDTAMGTDEAVRIEKDEDDISVQSSVDGAGGVSVSNNHWHTVTITTMMTSKANKYLSGLHKAGLLLAQKILVVPLVIVDSGSNGDLLATDKAILTRIPDQSYQREIQSVEWVFKVYNPIRFIAGH
jgi:hypothetical protein